MEKAQDAGKRIFIFCYRSELEKYRSRRGAQRGRGTAGKRVLEKYTEMEKDCAWRNIFANDTFYVIRDKGM